MSATPTARHTRIGLVLLALSALILPGAAWAQVSLSQVESDIAWLINTERAQAGRSQLATDPALAEVARAHSQEMRDRGYFGHESPVAARKTPADRYKLKFGVAPANLRENVGLTTHAALDHTVAQTIHTGFLNSPSHRENMMAEDVSLMGIACVTDGDGQVWTTQLFSVPPPALPAPSTQEPDDPKSPTARPTGPSPVRTASPYSGVSRPVTLAIWRVVLEPGTPAQLKGTILPGQGIRWGAAAGEAQALRVSVTLPGRAQPLEGAAVTVQDARTLLAADAGEWTLTLLSPQALTCRVVVVSGDPEAVRRYGTGWRSPTVLLPGTSVTGSLGDSGGVEVFTVGGPGEQGLLRVSWLDAAPANARLALFDSLGDPVHRADLSASGPQPLNIALDCEDGCTVVLTAPSARPGCGDFTIGWFTSDDE